MRHFYRFIVYHPRLILTIFAALLAVSAVCMPMVGVNYDMNDYLPEDSPSTVALDVMGEEFDGGIPNARVLLYDVSIAEALRYKDMLSAVEGVTDVLWLDDSADVSVPLSALDEDLVETYYKNGNALMTLTIDEADVVGTVDTVRAVIGEENAMSGAAVSTAVATTSTVTEIPLIASFAVVFTFIVLLLTTQSWLEPVIVLGSIGVAVLLVPRGSFALEKTLSDALHELPEVTDVISYVDTAGAQIPVSYLEDSDREKLLSGHYSRMVVSVDADFEGKETSALVQQIRELAQICYPDSWLLAGEGVSTYDLMDTITADMGKVNAVSIGAVFLVLLLSMKSLLLPVVLVLDIEAAIWLNTACPYIAGSTVFYISYLIITSVQLGATVDYAILFTEHYTKGRKTMGKRDALADMIETCTVSILSSGSVLTCVGYLLGGISSHGILSQLGTFLGRGTLFSLGIVIFVLPGMLYVLDGPIRLTTLHADFCPAKGPQKPQLAALPEQPEEQQEAPQQDTGTSARRRRRSEPQPSQMPQLPAQRRRRQNETGEGESSR